MAITSPKKKEELSKQFKINPEINAKLDSFMKEEPGLVDYVKELPREQLERKFLLRKMQDRDQKEGYSAKVKAWLEKHPRFRMHFTPTSSSWLNVIENFFGQLTGKRLRRGAFRSVPQLIEAIMQYVKAHNDDPTPIVWTATVASILAKVGRAKVALNSVATA